MRTQRPKPDEWRVLDLTDTYAAGQCYMRLDWLMQFDPFTALLSKETRDGICNLFFSSEVLGMDSVNAASRMDASEKMLNALNLSPLALLLTDEFKRHVVGLGRTAIYAGKPENPYPLG